MTDTRYGLRDAICVLQANGHRVAARPPGESGGLQRWTLNGEPATWRQLEDAAEQYERLRYRITERQR